MQKVKKTKMKTACIVAFTSNYCR